MGLWWLLACAPPVPLPYPVQFGGCQEVREGPVCAANPGDDTVIVWVDAPGNAVLEVEGADNDGLGEFVPELAGWRFRVSEYQVPGEIVVTSPEGEWALQVEGAPWRDELLPVMELGRSGDLEGAIALVRETEWSEGTEPYALSLEAKLLFMAGSDDSAEVAAEANETHLALGNLQTAGIGLSASVFQALQAGVPAAETARMLGSIPSLPESLELEYASALHAGLVESSSGRLLQAELSFQEALDAALRRDHAGRLQGAAVQLNTVRLETGQYQVALDTLLLEVASAPTCHAGASVSGWLGSRAVWVLTRNELAGNPPLLSEPDLNKLLDQVETDLQECGRPSQQANALINRAILLTLRGEPDTAADLLGPISATTEDGEDWIVWVQSQRHRASGQAERAVEGFASLHAPAGWATNPSLAWRACIDHGTSLAIVDPELALDVFSDCVERREGVALATAVAGGFDGFIADGGHGVQAYAALLLDQGRPAEAWRVIRAHRSSPINSIATRLETFSEEESVEWDRLVDEYRALRLSEEASYDDAGWDVSSERAAEGERLNSVAADLLRGRLRSDQPARSPMGPAPQGVLVLGWLDTGDGWVSFAQTESSVRVHTLGGLDLAASPAELGDALLSPWTKEIGGSRQVLLLPGGRLQSIDVHGLPVNGVPLALQIPTAYKSDAGGGAGEVDSQALVVIDPTGGLPAASGESGPVSQALAERGLEVNLHRVGTTRSEIIESLPTASTFHYSGHASYGESGWDAKLQLANGTALTTRDVLTLSRVPGNVVLIACETGRSSKLRDVASMSLAQAFIVSGADNVIASTRRVDDGVAAEFSIAYHTALATGADPANAYRSALLAIQTHDWSTFRHMVP
jgi:hypothetical protein